MCSYPHIIFNLEQYLVCKHIRRLEFHSGENITLHLIAPLNISTSNFEFTVQSGLVYENAMTVQQSQTKFNPCRNLIGYSCKMINICLYINPLLCL